MLLNLIELVGVLAVGPGFWISFAVTAALLGVYLVHLRSRAVADRRRRRKPRVPVLAVQRSRQQSDRMDRTHNGAGGSD